MFALSQIISAIKDILFPVYCVNCGTEGEWWCARCRRAETSQLIVERSLDSERLIEMLVSLFWFDEQSAGGRAIHRFKYQYAHGVGDVWQAITLDKIKELSPFITEVFFTDLVGIVPVPLNKKRERERGFNQSAIVAQNLYQVLSSANFNVEITPVLIRNRYTLQQARLSKTERQTNVAGAFAINSPVKIPSQIILVDDVYTTGATVAECARVLKQNGVKKIMVFTLAKAR